jgi:hypothetical protein
VGKRGKEMNFIYKEIKNCVKELGLLELYDLESTIKKEFIRRNKLKSDKVDTDTESGISKRRTQRKC